MSNYREKENEFSLRNLSQSLDSSPVEKAGENGNLSMLKAGQQSTNSEDGSAKVHTDGHGSKRKKIITTLVIYYCNFCMGVTFSILGPVVIDFSHKFNTSVAKISIAFTVLTASYLSGALSGGFIYNLVPRKVAVLFYLSLQSICIFVIPHVTSILPFFIAHGFLGFGVGGYDTGQVAWVIEIWRGDASVWILGQHCAYSFGTIVPPLLLTPFLKNREEIQLDLGSATNGSTVASASNLVVPFTIAGFIITAGVAMNIFFLIKDRSSKSIVTGQTQSEVSEEGQTQSSGQVPSTNRHQMLLLVFLSCCFIGSYQGMEVTSMQFLPTFSVFSDLKLTESEGAQMLFYLTIAFSLGRLIGIFIGLRVAPQFILVGNFLLIIGANVVLLLGGQTNMTWMWIGSILLGTGFSTVYPAYYAYVEKYLYVTNTIAAAVTFSGGLVSAIYPLIVGNQVERNPSALIYVNIFSIVIFTCTFMTVFFVTRKRDKKQNK